MCKCTNTDAEGAFFFLLFFSSFFLFQEAVSVSMRSASLLRMLAERQPDINAANSKLVRYLKEAAAASTLSGCYQSTS
jgi:hypothetical protein